MATETRLRKARSTRERPIRPRRSNRAGSVANCLDSLWRPPPERHSNSHGANVQRNQPIGVKCLHLKQGFPAHMPTLDQIIRKLARGLCANFADARPAERLANEVTSANETSTGEGCGRHICSPLKKPRRRKNKKYEKSMYADSPHRIEFLGDIAGKIPQQLCRRGLK